MKRHPTWAEVLDNSRATLKRGFSAWTFVVKLMIPALIAIRLLLYFDLVGPAARVFEPAMSLVGLPPETALVWISGLVANLYVSISVYLALAPLLDPALTLAQMTVLGGMCLLAHSLLVEGQICRGTGLSFWRVSVFRIFAGFLWGFLIHKAAGLTGWGAEPAQIKEFVNMVSEPVPPWGIWVWLTLKQLFLILLLIEALLLLMEACKFFNLTRLLMKAMGPPLKLAGVSDSAMMVTIIGCMVGLGYGGGLIVAESRSGHLAARDIFGSVMFMCFFHSMLEDTLLMWALGGSLWCFLVLRLALALALTAGVTRLALNPFWRPFLVGPERGANSKP
ncbi:MAG: hypothetical protein LBV70_05680 [Candidatus Adiutrix sp.]|jgi:hypothetical protein|nr:hypothetical protein [Candidatus Adiutrix sp.]